MKNKDRALILDIDDTCLGFTEFLIQTHNALYGTIFKPEDITTWDMPKELNDLYKRFENHGLYTLLPLLPTVLDTINHFKLVKKFKIVLLTARPEHFGEATFLSLTTHKIPFDELIFSSDKVKAIRDLAKKYHVTAFVDDKLSTVEVVNEKCRVDYIFLKNMTHNKKEDLDHDIIRINSLIEIIGHVK